MFVPCQNIEPLFLPSHFFLHGTSVDLFKDKIESSVRPYDSELCQSGPTKSHPSVTKEFLSMQHRNRRVLCKK
jgi:hypothetical protein